jgi:hypothetical protein
MLAFILFSLVTGITYASCPVKTHFIAAVMESEAEIQVWINTRGHWEKTGYLVDHYTDKERQQLSPILEYANLCEIEESVFAPCSGAGSSSVIIKQLQEKCIPVEPDFQRWAESVI